MMLHAKHSSFLFTAVVSAVSCLSVAFGGNPAYDPPANYYSTVNTSSAATLRTTLHAVIDGHTVFPYTASGTDTWNILEAADQDPGNSANIIDIYLNASYPKVGGGNTNYNREHRWPKSLGFPDEGTPAYTDCHGLALSNDSYNSSRGNSPYGNCTSGCNPSVYPTLLNNGIGGNTSTFPENANYLSGGLWDVWISRRGDVARAMFYMDVRYEGDSGEPNLVLTDNRNLIQITDATGGGTAYMGLLSDLLVWHFEDPVDDFERRRNQVVFGFQGNRNPFVDHPEWVCLLFNQGVCADVFAPAAPSGLSATGGNGAVSLDWNDNSEPDFSTYSVYRSTTSGSGFGPVATGLTSSKYLDISVVNGTTYFYRVTALDSFNESVPSAEQSATPTLGGADLLPPAVPANLVATPGDSTVSLSWNAGSEPDLAGYNLYRSESASGPFVKQNSGLILVASRTDSSVVNGTTYFYHVTAVDSTGNESAFSSQQSATPVAAVSATAWINEFHYDNIGTDEGEFIEIAGTAGLDLTGWTLVLYNGADGNTYNPTVNLSTATPSAVIPDLGNCYGVVYVNYSPNQLQNGNDAIALVDDSGTVVQFIAYEGAPFTVNDGPAAGTQPTVIGVEESNTTTPIGHSLQLSGANGQEYSSFTWQAPQPQTKGAFNTGQTFANGCPVETIPPTVQIAAVSPDPRNTAVASMSIVFSEPVANMTKSSITLSLESASLDLSAATLTTSDSTTFTLGNLTSLTSASGEYLLVVSPGVIEDLAGNALVAGDLEGWTADFDAPETMIISPTTNQSNASGIFEFNYTFSDGSGEGTTGIKLFYSTNGSTFFEYPTLFSPTGNLSMDVSQAAGSGSYYLYTAGIDALWNEESAPVSGSDVALELTTGSAIQGWMIY